MSLLKRIRGILSANINHVLEKAEDPEVMIKQLIRDMDEEIIRMRLEVARAIAAEKKIRRRLAEMDSRARQAGQSAEIYLAGKREDEARKALADQLRLEKESETLKEHHARALSVSTAMKDQLRRLEDKIQEARRKKEILIARKRSADARQSVLNSSRRISSATRKADSFLENVTPAGSPSMDSLEEQVTDMEVQAEALEDLMGFGARGSRDYGEILDDDEISRRLDAMRKKRAKE